LGLSLYRHRTSSTSHRNSLTYSISNDTFVVIIPTKGTISNNMFSSTLSVAFLVLYACQSIAQNASTSKIGYSGVLTKTDGGLGGTVTVKDAMTLEITSYTLKDASAPALYWYVNFS
jgi:hypothetical protein